MGETSKLQLHHLVTTEEILALNDGMSSKWHHSSGIICLHFCTLGDIGDIRCPTSLFMCLKLNVSKQCSIHIDPVHIKPPGHGAHL